MLLVQKTSGIIGSKPSKIVLLVQKTSGMIGPKPSKIRQPNDVQKYILYGFLPAAGGKFLAICSPEMHFLKSFEEYLTSKSQKFSPAAQVFGPN